MEQIQRDGKGFWRVQIPQGAEIGGELRSELLVPVEQFPTQEAAGARFDKALSEAGLTLSQLTEQSESRSDLRSIQPNQITRQGAPLSVRYAVGGAPGPFSREATLQQYYPDAVPYGSDNFVYTDNGQVTLYNPPGFDVGDIPSIAPEAAEAVGGMIGGTLAARSNPTSRPRIAAGVGLGAAAAKEAENLIARGLTERRDLRDFGTMALDTATTAGINAVGQGVSDLMVSAAKSAIQPIVRRYFTKSSAPEIYQSMESVGAPQTAGITSQSRLLAQTEGFLSETLGGASVFQRVRDAQMEAMDNFSNQIAARAAQATDSSMTPVTPDEMGRIARRQAMEALQAFRTNSAEVWGRLERLVPRSTIVQADNLLSFVDNELAQTGGEKTQALLTNNIRRYIDVADEIADEGGTQFSALMRLRSKVGAMMENPATYGDLDQGQVKRLYAALSEDIRAAAAEAGPDALKAFERANRYTRFNHQANIDFLNSIVRKNVDADIFKMLSSGTKEGAGVLMKARNNLTAPQFDTLVGTILQRMGRANASRQGYSGALEAADTFSAETFLTNYSKLSTEAKRALFSGERYAPLRQGLDDLARAASAIKQYAGTAGNPPNSGNRMVWLEQFGLLGTLGYGVFNGTGSEAAATAAAIVSPRVAAKLLTKPEFVRWLTSGMRLPANPNSVIRHIGRLGAIAATSPEIEDEIREYQSLLLQNAPNAGALPDG